MSKVSTHLTVEWNCVKLFVTTCQPVNQQENICRAYYYLSMHCIRYSRVVAATSPFDAFACLSSHHWRLYGLLKVALDTFVFTYLSYGDRVKGSSCTWCPYVGMICHQDPSIQTTSGAHILLLHSIFCPKFMHSIWLVSCVALEASGVLFVKQISLSHRHGFGSVDIIWYKRWEVGGEHKEYRIDALPNIQTL